jgi:hypothetical protein
MKRHLAFCTKVAFALWMAGVSPAAAQGTNLHTWVSRSGTDSATCGDISSPCRTFQQAINITRAGGEVQCLDRVDLAGGFAIIRSLTITCGELESSNSANRLNVQVLNQINIGPSNVVTLQGLNLDGASFTD